jgi:hypothetical protein
MSIVVTIKQVIDPNLLPSYIDIGPGVSGSSRRSAYCC